MTTTLALIALIAFCGYCVQTVTGFGAMVISVPLGALLLPIDELLLLLLPLSIFQCSYIAVRYRGAIDTTLLLRWIIPVMGLGTAIGALLAPQLSGQTLRRALAVLILLLALMELYVLTRRTTIRCPRSKATIVIGLLGAGLMHGVYATGGPLLVYSIESRVKDKSVFRATLTVVWLLLNTALVTYFAVDGRYQADHPQRIALLVPGVVIAIIVGQRLHERLDGKRFRIATYSLLAMAAIVLLLR